MENQKVYSEEITVEDLDVEEETTPKRKFVGIKNSPPLDLSKYVGKIAPINEVSYYETSAFGKPYLRIATSPIGSETIGSGNDKKVISIRASKIVNLELDEKTGEEYATPNSKLGLLLKKFGVNHYNDLVGKKVVLIPETAKDGKEYLTF